MECKFRLVRRHPGTSYLRGVGFGNAVQKTRKHVVNSKAPQMFTIRVMFALDNTKPWVAKELAAESMLPKQWRVKGFALEDS